MKNLWFSATLAPIAAALLWLALMLLSATTIAAAPEGPAPDSARFREVRIREYIRAKLTTDYLVRQFKALGLQPANHGSYLQDVRLVQIVASPDTALMVGGGDAPLKLGYGDDMIVWTPLPKAEVSLGNVPLVFAGYGVVAPEYRWNDYAGLDVKGKIVVVLVNDPGHVDPKLFQGPS